MCVPCVVDFFSCEGEKRFKTVNDLVADGLITLYVDSNAKCYIESKLQ